MAFEFTYQAFDMEQYDPSTQNLNNMRDSELLAYLENPTAITSTLTTSLTVEDESVTQNYSVLSRGNLYLASSPSGIRYSLLSFDNLLLRYGNSQFQIEPNNTSAAGLKLILRSANVTGSNKTLTLPNATGLLISTGDTGTVTDTMLAGSITNAKLANSTISGISLGSNLATLTIGTGLSGTSYNGSTATTIDLANTAVTAASYTNASITVDAQGRLTAASSGTSPVTTVTGTSPIVSSGGATPAISLAANYGDTLNPYDVKTAAFVLAGPTTGAAAVPTFRAIVATDIPTLNQNTTGTAATVTGAAQTAITSVGTLTALRVDGNFGVGVNGLAQMGLRISKAISGSAFAQGIYLDGAIQPSVTSRADMVWTAGSVAASVTVPTVNQFYATLSGVGAGSTVTASAGFVAESNLGNPYSGTITNAYGFVGNLASGTNRYNLFMNGSAPNFLNGRLGVGVALTSGAMAQITNASASDKAFIVKGAASQSGDFLDVQDSSGTSKFKVDSVGNVGISNTPAAGRSFVLSKTMTGSIAPIGFFSAGQIQSDATNSANYFNTFAGTAATAFTCGTIIHYKTQQGTIGAGSSVTSQIGFSAESSLIGAQFNYGFLSSIPISVVNSAYNYNLYINGTAHNYMLGRLGVGATLTSGAMAQVVNTTAADDVLILKGAAVQAGDFFDVQDSSGTSQFKVDSAGNVGIGLSSPTVRLEVRGSTTISSQTNVSGAFGTTTSGRLLVGSITGNTPFIGSEGATTLAFTTNSTVQMRIDSAGNIGIGAGTSASRKIIIGGSFTGGTGVVAQLINGTFASDVLTEGVAFRSVATTAAASFTLPALVHYHAVGTTRGAGSTITSQYGFLAASTLTTGTNNYGFFGDLASSANNYNLYMGGTAQNYLAGNTGIGVTVPTSKLHVVGSFSRGAPVTKTGAFTLADTENWIICNGTATFAVTLPAASTQVGREITIKTIAAFTVTSATANVVPIAGGAAGTAILPATAGAWAKLVSDGTNWVIMQS